MRFFVFKLRLIYIISISCLLVLFLISFAKAVDDREVVELPVIMYHSVLKDSSRRNEYIVTVEQFENDIKYLLNRGFVPITIQDLSDYVYKNKRLPQKPVMLTFDDGFYNNASYVYPYCLKYSFPIVISVVGKYTEIADATDDVNPAYSYLRSKDIRELSQSGLVEFVNHTYNLHSLDGGSKGSMKISWESDDDYYIRLKNDINKTQELLIQNTGHKPLAFTYPFGKISKASYRVIDDMGFVASLSCFEGMNYISRDKECLRNLKRYNRSGMDTTNNFMKKLLSK